MAKSAEEISKYAFGSADELLVDANVWFFVYEPHRPADPRAVAYSGAFARILNAKGRIYVDVLIISEFVNAYARLKYNILRGRLAVRDFKQFRKSSTFKAIARDIAADVRKLLTNCARVESGFARLDIWKRRWLFATSLP